MNDQASGDAAAWELQATFASPDQMQAAVSKLSMSGFDRADLSLPSPGLVEGTETPEAGTKPAATDADARQARTLGASTAAAAAALVESGRITPHAAAVSTVLASIASMWVSLPIVYQETRQRILARKLAFSSIAILVAGGVALGLEWLAIGR